MELPEVRMSFPDRAALERDVEENLRLGRAFLPCRSELAVLSECTLVLVHPEHGQELRLFAQVVMVNESGPMCGIGIALRGFGAEQLDRLDHFVRTAPEPIGPSTASETALPCGRSDEAAPWVESPTRSLPPLAAELAAAAASIGPAPVLAENVVESELETAPVEQRAIADNITIRPEPTPTHAPPPLGLSVSQRPTAPPSAAELLGPLEEMPDDSDDAGAVFDETEVPLEPGINAELQSENKHDRLRHLNAAQQLKVARTGELADRIAVERLYGKQVWSALLQNPRLTVPEVARIARKGTVPKPLLEVILENPGWLKTDAVRRALLSNPKVGPDAVLKLLRATSKHELKLIERGTAYAATVRDAARKLLRQ
jgi:hypothetical protein